MRPTTTVPSSPLGLRELDRPRLEPLLDALLDALPSPILLLDPGTNEALGANRAFLELTGLPMRKVAGTRPPFPWLADGAVTAGLDVEHPSEQRYRRPDGRTLHVEVSGHTISGEDGSPVVLCLLVADLSERRRVEQQLVQSGKLTALGELAAGVAHEINNPLFAILGLTEFLLKDAEPGSKERARLELIEQTGLEIKEIVRGLLDFARENAGERHLVSLEEVVRSTLDLVRRTNAHKGVELIDAYDGSGALVQASTNQVKQVVLNLIANARQAMPDGGTVHIDVHGDDGHVLVTVSDDGPGVPLELVGRIFEPFFTTRREAGGTGLGLAASLGIAHAHGGSLSVATEPGRGAAFTLRLPVAGEAGG